MLYPISVLKPNSLKNSIGYIDCSGRVVVSPTYAAGTYFSEGLASVQREDGWSGFIDANGEARTPFRFRGLSLFHEGLCPIDGSLKRGYVNRQGEVQIQGEFCVAGRFSEGLAAVSFNGYSFGYINRMGKLLIAPKYEQLGHFVNGCGAACFESRWGYISRDGSIVIPFHFDGPRAQPFTNGLAGVNIGGKWGFINTNGDWVVMPEYEDASRFYEGVAAVRYNKKWGLIDSDGRVLVTPRFDYLGELNGGMIPAYLDGKAGFISIEGNWIIEPQFDECYRFIGDLAVVENMDTYRYISRSAVTVWESERYAMTQFPPFNE